jgi:hypothetical protein
MSFDDSWYGMQRHRGERGVFIPGEGFRAAPTGAGRAGNSILPRAHRILFYKSA